MNRLTVAILLVVLAGASLAAQTTQPIDPAAVSKLVEQLAADDAGVRDAAKASLTAMGSSVTPELRKAIESTSDADVRTTLQVLLSDLEKLDQSGPTLVTLHVKDATARGAVESLAEQAGIEIGVWPDWVWKNAKGRVTINADKQPFWPVLMDVCSQGGLHPQDGHLGRGKIVLGGGNRAKKPLPQYYRDGILFVASSANRNHNVDYGSGQANNSFAIAIKAYLDPRINALRGPSFLNLTEALDDKGNSLLPPGKRQQELRGSPWGANWAWDVAAHLHYQPNQGRVLKSLKGTASFAVIEDADLWEMDLKNFEPAERPFPGGTYRVESFTRQGASYSVKINIRSAAKGGMFGRHGNRNELYTSTDSIRPMLKLVDGKGRTWPAGGLGGGGSSENLNYQVSFQDEGGGEGNAFEPIKLVWSIPRSLKQIDVPVEFKDLPIP